MDRCTAHRLRVEEKLSPYEPHPLLHACKADSLALQCRFNVKAGTEVADGEMNLVRRSPQLHLKSFHAAMPDCVVQSLLQHAKQAKRDFPRHVAWQIVRAEVDLRPLAFAELGAKTLHRCKQAQIFQ